VTSNVATTDILLVQTSLACLLACLLAVPVQAETAKKLTSAML